MPRKSRRRVARIKYSTDEAGAAAEAIVPVAKGVVQQLVQRCAEMARDVNAAAPRRPRGRGAQPKPTEQMLIMFWAQTVTDRPGMTMTHTQRTIWNDRPERLSTAWALEKPGGKVAECAVWSHAFGWERCA